MNKRHLAENPPNPGKSKHVQELLFRSLLLTAPAQDRIHGAPGVQTARTSTTTLGLVEPGFRLTLKLILEGFISAVYYEEFQGKPGTPNFVVVTSRYRGSSS